MQIKYKASSRGTCKFHSCFQLPTAYIHFDPSISPKNSWSTSWRCYPLLPAKQHGSLRLLSCMSWRFLCCTGTSLMHPARLSVVACLPQRSVQHSHREIYSWRCGNLHLFLCTCLQSQSKDRVPLWWCSSWLRKQMNLKASHHCTPGCPTTLSNPRFVARKVRRLDCFESGWQIQ